MKHYVYITTNLINGKQYIGDHSTNNLNDSYLGSGKIIKDAIKKYGKPNFKKEILELFDTKQEAFNAQEKWIKKYRTLITENGYNISPKGGTQVHGGMNEESRRNISEAQSGRKQSKETKEKRSRSLKGHKVSEETRKKIIEGNCGKKRSKETRNRIRISKLNMTDTTRKRISDGTKHAMKDPKIRKKISDSKKGKIPWNKNIIFEEVVCPYCNKTMKKSSNYTRYHNENCKMKCKQ